MNVVLIFSERVFFFFLLNGSVWIKAFSYRTTGPAEISEFYCDFEGNKSKKIVFKGSLGSNQSGRHRMQGLLCGPVRSWDKCKPDARLYLQEAYNLMQETEYTLLHVRNCNNECM